jgi:hypothetical protein
MSKIAVALAIASGVSEAFDAIRTMIGPDELALVIAKSFAEAAGITLSPTAVAKAMKGKDGNGVAQYRYCGNRKHEGSE